MTTAALGDLVGNVGFSPLDEKATPPQSPCAKVVTAELATQRDASRPAGGPIPPSTGRSTGSPSPSSTAPTRPPVNPSRSKSAASLSFAEFKAVASGNPLLVEQMKAQHELTRYTSLHTAHERNQHSLAATQHELDRLTTD